MIWTTVADVREYWTLQTAAYSDEPWPTLNADDPVVQTQLDSAVRALVPSVLRWPCLGDDDRPDDPYVQEALTVAVAETIRARLINAAADKALGGATAAAILRAGGSVTADNLSVSGGSGARVGSSATPVPEVACDALWRAGMTGGPVATW